MNRLRSTSTMTQPALKLIPSLFENARLSVRVRVFIPVNVDSEHDSWSGLTLDLSDSGAFVATHHRIPVGSLLLVHLRLPPDDEPIVIVAFVRWTREYSERDEVPPGVGLEFVDLEPYSRATIRRFLQDVRAQMLFEDDEN